MKTIKDELQNIILGDESIGNQSQLKKIQCFLRTNAEAGIAAQKQQRFKSEEATDVIAFALKEGLFFNDDIKESNFISEGAEQKVYRYNGTHIIKTNAGIFYEYWLDYFNSLLIHNYFFPPTAYEFLGFKVINNELNAVVAQKFIFTSEATDLNMVKEFLEYNSFKNNRNNDYINTELGIILEDIHDENVLFVEGILFFIDTVFYLTPEFYKKQ